MIPAPRSNGTHDALVRQWWHGIEAETPAALPADPAADWRELFERAQRDGLSPDRAAAAANAAHTTQRDLLRIGSLPEWSLGATDEELRNRADALARMCERMASDVRHYQPETAPATMNERMATLARKEAPWLVLDMRPAEMRRTLGEVARSYRVSPPTCKDDMAAIARYSCSKWWRRQLRKAQRMEVEQAKIAAGLVREGRQVYCSDAQVKLRRQQNLRNRQMLEAVKAMNEEGQEYTLAELVEVSPSDPVVKISELTARMRGLEDFAHDFGHVSRAYTITAPSWMHPCDRDYRGTTPREAQQWLCGQWEKARAKLKRDGIAFYGFRVAEPHKDGAPHWHMVLFFENAEADNAFHKVMRQYFLEDVWTVRMFWQCAPFVMNYERGADRVRVKRQFIKTSATGYLLKYISKNISGLYVTTAHPDLFDAEGTRTGFPVYGDTEKRDWIGNSVELSERVQAWATCWGIRQFQPLGGPPVTMWRELRRIEGELAGNTDVTGKPLDTTPDLSDELAEQLREPADATTWSAFCMAWMAIHDGCTEGTTPNVPRRERLAAPVYWSPDIVLPEGDVLERIRTQYGDLKSGQVAGFEVLGKFFGTRVHSWQIEGTADQLARHLANERSESAARSAEAVALNGRRQPALGVLSVTVRGFSIEEAQHAYARHPEILEAVYGHEIDAGCEILGLPEWPDGIGKRPSDLELRNAEAIYKGRWASDLDVLRQYGVIFEPEPPPIRPKPARIPRR